MVISYAEDTSTWEEWQRDYRLGLLLIMPPPQVSRTIDALRARYDPRSHAICPTHISVSDPLRREMTPAAENELRRILRSIQPFRLRFNRPRASADRAGVACPVHPQEKIDALKQVLHAASLFAGQTYRRRNIPAHITIAEFISIQQGLKICARLQDTVPGGSFLCDRLALVVPDNKFRFQRQGTFLLGDANA